MPRSPLLVVASAALTALAAGALALSAACAHAAASTGPGEGPTPIEVVDAGPAPAPAQRSVDEVLAEADLGAHADRAVAGVHRAMQAAADWNDAAAAAAALRDAVVGAGMGAQDVDRTTATAALRAESAAAATCVAVVRALAAAPVLDDAVRTGIDGGGGAAQDAGGHDDDAAGDAISADADEGATNDAALASTDARTAEAARLGPLLDELAVLDPALELRPAIDDGAARPDLRALAAAVRAPRQTRALLDAAHAFVGGATPVFVVPQAGSACVDVARAADLVEALAAACDAAPPCARAAVGTEIHAELLEAVSSSCHCGARGAERDGVRRLAAAAARLPGLALDDVALEAAAATRAATARFQGACDR